MAHGRARGAQEALEFEAGDHVRALGVGVDVGQDGGIERLAAGADDHGPDLDVPDRRLLVVIDGLGQTGTDALPALATVAAVDAAPGFAPAVGLLVAEFHLPEIPLALRHRQLGHARPRPPGLVQGHGPVKRMFVFDRFAPLGHVAAVDVAQDGFGRLLAGGNGADGHPGAGQEIAAGEHPRPFGRVGDGVGFHRPPAREGETGHLLQGRQVRPLPDGRDDLVAFDLEFAARDGHRPPAAGGIRFGQLHADAAQAGHLAVPGEDFLRRSEIGDLGALGFRRPDLLLPGRHLRAGAAVDDVHLLRPEPDGRARHVDGDVAAADDGDPPADPGHAREVDLAQEIDPLAHPVGTFARDAELDSLVGAQRQIDRLEALGEEAVDGDIPAQRGVGFDLDPEVGDDLDLAVEHVPRQAVVGNTDAQHPAGRRQGLEDGRANPLARQVVGAGQARRARADDRHLFGARRRAGDGEFARVHPVGGQPLQVADGDRFVLFGPAAGILAPMGADPPQNTGQRQVLHDDLEGLVVLALLDHLDIALHVQPGRACQPAGRLVGLLDGEGPRDGLGVLLVGGVFDGQPLVVFIRERHGADLGALPAARCICRCR